MRTLRIGGLRFGTFVLATLGLAAFGLGALAAPLAAESKKARRAKLERINQRWEGAEVRLKHAFKLKGRGQDDGWYKGGVYSTDRAPGMKILTYRLRVRDLEPLRSSWTSGYLIPGTRFIAEGFRFRDPDDEQGVYLAMRSAIGDVPAELMFWGRAGKPDLEAVESIEQYLRMEVLNVRAETEQLVSAADAPPPSSAPPFGLGPPPGALPSGSQASGAQTSGDGAPGVAESVASGEGSAGDRDVFRPVVELLAVSVQPVRVEPGGSVELIATYSVDGLPPGAAFEVVEQRALLADERRLTEEETPVARVNGTYTSSQTARIPPGAPAGVYRLEVAISLPGAEGATASALFEVAQ